MDSRANAALLPKKSRGDSIPTVVDDEIPFISLLPKYLRKRVLISFKMKWFDAGSPIIFRGDKRREVFFLQTGSAQVINYSESGRVIAYATLEPGDMFGELAAIDAKPRSATVIAKTDCSVNILKGKEFMRLITEHQPLNLYVLQRLAEIVRGADDLIEDLSLLGAEQRVCLELMHHLEPDPGNLNQMRVYPAPTQVAIAESIGVTRQTVARVFSRLFKEGTIERRGKSLFVMDCDQLEKTAFRV